MLKFGSIAPPTLYRVQVVTAFLKAGVPLQKVTSFRDILEDHAFRLSDRRNMHDHIPFILKEEGHIQQEINGKYLSVIFDGTSRLGEALVVILRFIDDSWCLQQRVVHLQMLAKS